MGRAVPRIVIFGCGSAGQRAYVALRDQGSIVGFVDNNSQLHGTSLHGVPVLPPSALYRLQVDRVVIGSMFYEDIRRQLVEEIGMEVGKVELAPEFEGRPRGIWARSLRSLKLPSDFNQWRLWCAKNRHRDQRAFIIGNGPSLRMDDLDRLAEHNEITLAGNKIFLAYPGTKWRPSYWGVQDPDTPRQAREEIETLVRCPMFVSESLRTHLPPTSQRIYFRSLLPPAPPKHPKFSFELLEGLVGGRTITYALLQIAAWLGFSEAYLLGVDFDYSIGEVFDHREHKDLQAYTYNRTRACNYFVSHYHRHGEVIIRPYLDYQRCAYEAALDQCHHTGRMKIYNATRGGRLEIFERVNFDTLF